MLLPYLFLLAFGENFFLLTLLVVEIALSESSEKVCDCSKCTGLKINTGKEYPCCNQGFKWRDFLGSDENPEGVSCVTESQAYISSVNPHAVRGMLHKPYNPSNSVTLLTYLTSSLSGYLILVCQGGGVQQESIMLLGEGQKRYF